ncbi:MAG: hypothetical protein JKY15_01785 [Deltaproteobacteria bacterium]|nr:hypothetical protein [Deltaproteobacteria bacterium]
MTLNDSEYAVIWTKIRKFGITKSLEFVKEQTGETISESTYWRVRGKLSAEVTSRLYEIAKTLTERHLDRLHELEHIKDELWKQYDKIKDDDTKSIASARILKEIKEIIPYLSAFDEAAQYVYRDAVKLAEQEKQNPRILTLIPQEQ